MTDDGHEQPPKRRRGRPPGTGTGETPHRSVRIGPIWEKAATEARAEGESMAAFVTRALRKEVDRVRRARRRRADKEQG